MNPKSTKIVTPFGFSVNDSANSTGFEISKKRIKAQSKGYQKQGYFSRYFNNRLLFVFILLVLFSLFCHILLVKAPEFDAPRYYLLLSSLITLISLIGLDAIIYMSFVDFLDKQGRQWHACGHKVTKLIDNGLDLTLKNLKKMSRLDPVCSDQLLSLAFLALLANYLLAILTKLSVINSSIYLLQLAVVLFLFISYFLKIGLPTQYLTTKKPTEEQLGEALRVAKEFVRKSKEFEKSRD